MQKYILVLTLDTPTFTFDTCNFVLSKFGKQYYDVTSFIIKFINIIRNNLLECIYYNNLQLIKCNE